MEYQIQKLTRDSGRAVEQLNLKENESEATEKSEDLLRYHPKPEMLVSRYDMMAEVSFIACLALLLELSVEKNTFLIILVKKY